MMVGRTRNGHGVEVSLHRCCYCGESFTVTPATDNAWGLGCLDTGCESYDISRDADLFFEPALEAGWIRRETV